MQGTKVRSLSGELRPHIQWREGTLQWKILHDVCPTQGVKKK